ncbi:hypothetical protein NQ176_g9491 [Zarea fungicola]|uniref:Uncharacterized protein n=1 Tax=Zarea fungicola TaxID=93591 RepID=A0ACC1MMB4_9HYPO|nr:hypothetical protein NQ176_g9491 [Lecanicillium fungicola]
MSWFGFGKGQETQSASDEVKATAALPAAWYRSPAMYELERRAIFSRKWLLVTHKLRFPETGSYVKLTEAGHRAYPMVENESGKVSVLACKYHGWSYGFDGHLAKAPKYQEIPAFKKEENGLYRIHVHVDGLGFVYVNLDAGETPSVPWEQDFVTVDEQPRLLKFDLSNYHFDHQWEMMDLSKYWVETAGTHIQHYAVDKADPEAKSLGNVSTYYYPNASSTVTPFFFFIQRCVPVSATQTHMEYEVYRHNDATDEEFTEISDFFKNIMREDKDLCNGAQKNLNGGIFLNGELHPRVEKGPLFFQMLTRNLVTNHHDDEQTAGAEIWPAVPKHRMSETMQKDVDLCNKLDCGVNGLASAELAW